MQPLKLEWRLASHWAPPKRGLHLDGLVARALVEETIANHPDRTSVPEYSQMFADLPFERFEGKNGWCWKASMLQVVGKSGMSLRYITNKTPVIALAHAIDQGVVVSKGPAAIDTVRGHAKNGQMTYPLEWATGLQAWCIGDADALQHYLGRFDGLGYKQIRGHGTVMPFDDGSLVRITVDEDASELWRQRNLPDMLLDADKCFPDACALQPPYWQNRHIGWVPL